MSYLYVTFFLGFLIGHISANQSACECNCDYYVSVTSEGGDERQLEAECRTENITTGLFSINGVGIYNAPHFRAGLSFVVLDRSTNAIVSTHNFDVASDLEVQYDVIRYVEHVIPEDSIVMMSAFDMVIKERRQKYSEMWYALNKVGLVKRFAALDSLALIGYKPAPGLCSPSPAFIAESYEKNPTRSGRDGQWTAPASVTAAIPRNCDAYPQGQDFHVKVVSEGGNLGVEWEMDGVDSPSLFFIDESRVLGTTLYNGLNLVVIDSALRTAVYAETFSLNDEESELAFVETINELPDDTLVLLTVWNRMGNFCRDQCYQTLESLGANRDELTNGRINVLDNYSLIGYKGNCPNGAKPEWIQQGYLKNVGQSREGLYNPPTHTEANIPYPLCNTFLF